jgi:hypothetical protein
MPTRQEVKGKQLALRLHQWCAKFQTPRGSLALLVWSLSVPVAVTGADVVMPSGLSLFSLCPGPRVCLAQAKESAKGHDSFRSALIFWVASCLCLWALDGV